MYTTYKYIYIYFRPIVKVIVTDEKSTVLCYLCKKKIRDLNPCLRRKTAAKILQKYFVIFLQTPR